MHRNFIASLLVILPAALAAGPHAIGLFENQTDVGTVQHPGSATFDAAAGQYRVTGSGANIWNKEDDFHYLFRKLSGDPTFSANVHFEGTGGDAHRKACLMVRQSLARDAAYADVAVHGNGLISLQYRKQAGDITQEVQCPIKAPATVRLSRKGDVFTLAVAPKGESFRDVGSATIELHDPVYAGLAVSAHNAAVSETAVFLNVELQEEK